jgi:uncharacterized membrane protein
MNRKTTWLVWAIVILFLMNAATLGTIVYHNSKQQAQKPDTTAVAESFSGNVINGRFFRQTLGFDNQQMAAFQAANREFRPQTMDITLGIDSLKVAMFAEMRRQTPDTVKLSDLSKQIGQMHTLLKQKTWQFYLKLKAVSTEQQASQLEKAFEPLFINENLQATPHGFHQGWRKVKN